MIHHLHVATPAGALSLASTQLQNADVFSIRTAFLPPLSRTPSKPRTRNARGFASFRAGDGGWAFASLGSDQSLLWSNPPRTSLLKIRTHSFPASRRRVYCTREGVCNDARITGGTKSQTPADVRVPLTKHTVTIGRDSVALRPWSPSLLPPMLIWYHSSARRIHPHDMTRASG